MNESCFSLLVLKNYLYLILFTRTRIEWGNNSNKGKINWKEAKMIKTSKNDKRLDEAIIIIINVNNELLNNLFTTVLLISFGM